MPSKVRLSGIRNIVLGFSLELLPDKFQVGGFFIGLTLMIFFFLYTWSLVYLLFSLKSFRAKDCTAVNPVSV